MPSQLTVVPEALATASGELTGIGEALRGAAAAAVPATTGVLAAASDEVSAASARLFGGYASAFQTLTAQATAFHDEFVRVLSGAGTTYAAAEVANTTAAASTTATATGTAPSTNGVTGVKEGFAFLDIPVGPFGYKAPTHWYFPTQPDGSVDAQGVIYLQHGFGARGFLYDGLATQLAQETDSIVVVPTLPSLPRPFGAWLNGPPMQQAVGSLFLGSETALNISANQAGYQGKLPVDFIMTGHSAGGGLATAAAGDYVADLGPNPTNNHLLGVVMFDGVSSNSSAFASSIASLQTLGIPDYVVAAPPQLWNAFGGTTNELVSLYPNQFVGVELVGGSHVDSMVGAHPVLDFVTQLVTRFSPPGNTAAVYTLSSGWINDMYAGTGPIAPVYGLYGTPTGYQSPGGQPIILGQAAGIVLPV